MTRILSLIAMVLFLSGCFGDDSKSAATNEGVRDESAVTSTKSATSTGGKTHMRIKTVHGDVVIKFESEKAPATVARIQELVGDGFYNGIKFHRVIPGFVVQGGDPDGTGAGGSGKKLKAEISDLKHVPGVVAMARAGNDMDSADSQFYISTGTHPHLDGKYTIFGKVISGMENANKIVQGDKMLQVTLEQ